jgi:cation diffusion facilitator family transporter
VAEESRTAVLAALIGNGALAVLKAIAAAVTGSAAMLAETVHSIADAGNQALLFLGMRMARRPPDASHPFGHGRDVYFWAFVVSAILFSLGGGFALWEAVRTFLHHPAPHESYAWAYGVLGGAFVFESGALTVALRELRRDMKGEPLREYLRDIRDPTLLTVVLEDGAALVSIAIAATGLTLTYLSGSPVWDGIASGLIGVLLVAVAVFLAFDNYSLLIGEAAPREVQQRIREVVAADPDVERVTRLYTMHLGPDSLLVALGVHFRSELRSDGVAAGVARLERELVEALGSLTHPNLVLIEPAADDDGRRNAPP